MKIRAALALFLSLLVSVARADPYLLSGTVANAQFPGVADGDTVTFQVSYDPGLLGTGFYMPQPISNVVDVTGNVALPNPAEGLGFSGGLSGIAPFLQEQDQPGELVNEHLGLTLTLTGANWPASGPVLLDQLGYSSFDMHYQEETPAGATSFDVVGGPYQAAVQAPEPTSLSLLAAGMMAAGWRLRRRRTVSVPRRIK